MKKRARRNMKHNFQFLSNLLAPFPSWVHRAQPDVPICFQLSVAGCFFYRGFFCKPRNILKLWLEPDLCCSPMKIQIPNREGNFLCLPELAGAERYPNTTDNPLNVTVLANTGPLTLISPMSRGHNFLQHVNLSAAKGGIKGMQEVNTPHSFQKRAATTVPRGPADSFQLGSGRNTQRHQFSLALPQTGQRRLLGKLHQGNGWKQP